MRGFFRYDYYCTMYFAYSHCSTVLMYMIVKLLFLHNIIESRDIYCSRVMHEFYLN